MFDALYIPINIKIVVEIFEEDCERERKMKRKKRKGKGTRNLGDR